VYEEKQKKKAEPQAGKELPGPKGLFGFEYAREQLTAYEGLGDKGDIVALGCMPP
jgi:hypothetical protein